MFKKPILKKVAPLIISLLMVLTIILPTNAFAADNRSSSEKTFNIIGITDFHGTFEDSKGLPVASVLAKNIKDIKAKNPNRTLVVGAGDLYQGTPISNLLKGVPVQKFLDNIGMDITTLGNHEFDWGLDTFKDITMKDAKYPVVCANVINKSDKQKTFNPYKIIEKDGIRFAFVGALTLETPSSSLAANVEDFEFTDIAKEINSAVKEIKDGKKADVVIALIHEGGTVDDQGKRQGKIFDIVNSLQGVDAVFGGHTHTIVNTKVNNIPVMIANNAGKGYSNLQITIKDKSNPTFSSSYVALDNDKITGYKAASPLTDKSVNAILDEAKKEIGPLFNEKIGFASNDYNRIQDTAPYGESYLGNWVSDITKDAVGADVGLANNGSVRVDIPKGDLTLGSIYYIMPFDNTACTFNLTKSQLKAILEQGLNSADSEKNLNAGMGIQVAGIKISYDSSKPSFNRITDLTREDGTKISDTEILKVSTNNFLAGGGDGFTEFRKYSYVDTGVVIRDAMIKDVRAKKDIVTKMNTRLDNASNVVTPKGKGRTMTKTIKKFNPSTNQSKKSA